MEPRSTPLPAAVDHLVIGAGFAGLGAAIKLAEAGEDDFLVIEKDGGIGGTWRANTYPGAACDVPSQLYSFSFAPNPSWSMSFSPQPEIEAYLRDVAATSGTLDRFAFETELTDARWDEADQRWHVTTNRGEVVAKTLISGSGGLSVPKMPDIDGIESFRGEVFHSARWNHDVDLTGKRVAVIGTGASSIQIVPSIQPDVAHLDVYQRTAPYVLARNDRPYTGIEKLLFRHVPGVQKAYRRGIYWARELYVPGFVWDARLATPARKMALANLAQGHPGPRAAREGDAALRDRLQADPDLQHLLPRPRRRATSTWSPTRSSGSPATRSSPPTASSGRSTCSSWRPASRPRNNRSPSTSAAATATRSPTSGPSTGWRPTRAPPRTASPTSSRSSAPTPVWGTARWSS